jgi:hypothetical protein
MTSHDSLLPFSTSLEMKSKSYNGEVQSSESDLETLQLVPLLLQLCSSLNCP